MGSYGQGTKTAALETKPATAPWHFLFLLALAATISYIDRGSLSVAAPAVSRDRPDGLEIPRTSAAEPRRTTAQAM